MATASGIPSMRPLSKQVGVRQPFLSQIKACKRPMPESLRGKVEARGADHLLISDKQVGGGTVAVHPHYQLPFMSRAIGSPSPTPEAGPGRRLVGRVRWLADGPWRRPQSNPPCHPYTP